MVSLASKVLTYCQLSMPEAYDNSEPNKNHTLINCILCY